MARCLSSVSKRASSTFRLFTDGASRGNPGVSGGGAVLYSPEGNAIAHVQEYLGVRTCNYAEYVAVLRGLIVARALCIRNLHVYSDSELLVRQVNGVYGIHVHSLRTLHHAVKDKLRNFDECTFVHVRRDLNSVADQLANGAIDNRTKFKLHIDPWFKQRMLRARVASLAVHGCVAYDMQNTLSSCVKVTE